MNAFANNVGNEVVLTTNGMEAFKSTLDANVDLFYKIGASRGKDISTLFAKAYAENKELSLRIVQWARDVRGGAGERQLFRDVLTYLESRDKDSAALLMAKTPEIGRWDDLLSVKQADLRDLAFSFIAAGLQAQDGLAAKWMPRKGPDAVALRKFMNMTPKAYRKTLVSLTNVVETAMCAKQWDKIEFGKLPSVASARYKTAFYRNAEASYKAYVERLKKGEDKVNAAAVFPYDVLKGMISSYGLRITEEFREVAKAQWAALPNYMGDNKVLPLVDVSGSMMCSVGGNAKLTAMEVAVSLGLYCADKNTGPFKDLMLTFTGKPELLKLTGDILSKCDQMCKAEWGMSTDLMAAFEKVLSHATSNKVSAADMPDMLMIFSDMQFDKCVKFGGSAMDGLKLRYAAAGYELPKVVFWNLNSHDNVPVTVNDQGVALVSGFAPAVMKALLAGDLSMENFTPKAIMLAAVMVPRYNLETAPVQPVMSKSVAKRLKVQRA